MPKFFDNQADGFDVSKYNPAALKMARLNDIGKLLNQCKLSPLSFNQEFMDFNFNVWIRCINNLFGEINAKFTEEEFIECSALKIALEIAMNKYPIIEKNNQREIKTNINNWIIIKKYLEKYEFLIKSYQDAHGLDTPNVDDDEGL